MWEKWKTYTGILREKLQLYLYIVYGNHGMKSKTIEYVICRLEAFS